MLKSRMVENCDFKPMIDKVPGTALTCPTNLKKSFKDNANCQKCPKLRVTVVNPGMREADTFYVVGRKRDRLV